MANDNYTVKIEKDKENKLRCSYFQYGKAISVFDVPPIIQCARFEEILQKTDFKKSTAKSLEIEIKLK